MGKKKTSSKIKAVSDPNKAHQIHPTADPNDGGYVRILFSFRYLEDCGRFVQYDRQNVDSFEMIKRLCSFSKFTVNEFIDRKQDGYHRNHRIFWKRTILGAPSAGRSNHWSNVPEQVSDYPPYQISAGQEARIHGFLFKNIFYAVWIDPTHALSPDD